jgi:hypothetical protein
MATREPAASPRRSASTYHLALKSQAAAGLLISAILCFLSSASSSLAYEASQRISIDVAWDNDPQSSRYGYGEIMMNIALLPDHTIISPSRDLSANVYLSMCHASGAAREYFQCLEEAARQFKLPTTAVIFQKGEQGRRCSSMQHAQQETMQVCAIWVKIDSTRYKLDYETQGDTQGRSFDEKMSVIIESGGGTCRIQFISASSSRTDKPHRIYSGMPRPDPERWERCTLANRPGN